MDPVTNFGKVTVSTGYAAGAVSVVLVAGGAAKLPNPAVSGPFNLVWYDSTNYSDPSDDPNVEIVRCTVVSTETLTITRAQEGTADSNKNTVGATYKMVLAFTKKSYDALKSNIGVVQASHGLSVGNPIKCTGANTYAKAQADSAANAEVVGYVTEVEGSNNFVYATMDGVVTTGVPAVAAGTVLFLDPSTAGALTSTEPTTPGQISKPIGEVLENATSMKLFDMRGSVVGGAIEVTGTSDDLENNVKFIANNAALVTLTLPATAAVGSVIEVIGKGAGLWKIAQNAGQTILDGNSPTTTGATGYLLAADRYDCVRLVCVTADTDFVISSVKGMIFSN